MPLRKKNTNRTKIILWAAAIALLILMIISFPASQNMTEIVLFP